MWVLVPTLFSTALPLVRPFGLGSALSRSGTAATLTVRCSGATGEAEAGAPLTMADVREMFVDVREHYRENGGVEDGLVCRNMMVTRVKEFHLRIDRCRVGPSEGPWSVSPAWPRRLACPQRHVPVERSGSGGVWVGLAGSGGSGVYRGSDNSK